MPPHSVPEAAAPLPDPLRPTGDSGFLPPPTPAATAPTANTPTTSVPLPTPSPTAPTPPTAQIAAALDPGVPGVTALTLSPEELGQVRIDLRTEGTTATLTLSAERPETLDLLRRGADRLAEDLRAAGFQDLNLGFGRWGGDGQAPPERNGPLAAEAFPAAPQLPDLPPPGRPAAGLYLRL